MGHLTSCTHDHLTCFSDMLGLRACEVIKLVKRTHQPEPSMCSNQSFLHSKLDFPDTPLLCNGSYAANVRNLVRTTGLCTCIEEEKARIRRGRFWF